MTLTSEAKAAGRIASLAARQAKTNMYARIAGLWIRQYGPGLSNKEVARRLTANGVLKTSGKFGEWGGTDLRNLNKTLRAIYGWGLLGSDLRRLNEEADRYENALRTAKGVRPLTYEEWREVEAAPRPPLLVFERETPDELRRRRTVLQEARRLLKTKAINERATGPPSSQGIEERQVRQRGNERLGLLLGRRRYHQDRLTQSLSSSVLGKALLKAFALTGGGPLSWDEDIEEDEGEDRKAVMSRRERGHLKEILRIHQPTALMRFIAEYDARNEDAKPIHFPMIVPPKEWKGIEDGGFLTERRVLVKKMRKEQRKVLSGAVMPMVYHAVNALQATPFRINQRMLEVVQVMGAVNVGGTKKKIAEKLDAVRRQMSLANMLKEEPELYFTWELDWRGRMYPVFTAPVHPQADDIGKALLEFANGKPLGKEGKNWLAIHGANCYGEDKRSLRERVKWVYDHTSEICASADNPIAEAFWRKEGDPYQFLAFCFEWAAMTRCGNPEAFISHLPVAYDCSCNAYQHFAAMSQDEAAMEAVNIQYPEPVAWDTPSPFTDAPRDLYGRVAKVLSKLVAKDAAGGKEEARIWQGKIDNRQVVKPGVMTKSYGATSWRRKEQLKEKLETLGEDYKALVRNRSAIEYLEGQLKGAIAEVVPAADRAMRQLQEAARQLWEKKLPVMWTIPTTGFTALQEYPSQRKHVSGISANYVHSLDASHMMLTIDRCLQKGITDFAMVHDSYATHAANAGTLMREVWKAFWDQQRSGVYDPERGPILLKGLEWPKVEYEEYEPPDIPEGMDPFEFYFGSGE